MKNKLRFLISAFGLTAIMSSNANADDTHHSSRADDHAPIGVMGDHLHKKGEWMTSYRYSYMEMNDNYDGDSKITPAEVRAKGFGMAPVDMTMDMHMIGVMYGLTDDITIMAMGSYIEKDMTMENGANVLSTMESEGFGDTKISALYRLKEWGNNRIHLNAGISLPTGSIDEAGSNGLKLPYSMQLGSGTFDLLPAVTYASYQGKWSWGGQASANIRLGENDDNYSLGDEFKLTAWGAHNINESFSVSLRVEGSSWGDVDGADPAYATRQAMSPLFRADLRRGNRVETSVGANYIIPEGVLKDHRIGLEATAPVYQDLDSYQLGRDYRLMIGWQKSF